MRLGVDVGGTNTDAVLMNGTEVVAWAKHPSGADVSEGIAAAIEAVLEKAGVGPDAVSSVMVGTTQFANALVERRGLQEVGVIRLASPSGDALPPMSGWPLAMRQCIGDSIFLLPGGYEFDGREISAFDENKVRDVARSLRRRGIFAATVTCAFAPMNPDMEERAAAIIREEHEHIRITLSGDLPRIGFLERENAAILNAALSGLAIDVVASFKAALRGLNVSAPLYVSQNDGTLISAAQAARCPVMTIGSGPTNSMRGAAFLTGVSEAIILDVGGTTTDVGALVNGFPRESSIAAEIGDIRTNFRMPDILSIGLGGGTRIHLDPSRYAAEDLDGAAFAAGPDSVGYRLTSESLVFGGRTLTASDVAIAAGRARFGDPSRLPLFSSVVVDVLLHHFQRTFEDAIDRMKTVRQDVPILAVGGGSFLIPESLKGAARVVRPPYASVANAIGAAIAQVGAQVERIVSYETTPRTATLEAMGKAACDGVVAAGGDSRSVRIADVEEVLLSYLPGRTARVRVRAVGDLASGGVERDSAAICAASKVGSAG